MGTHALLRVFIDCLLSYLSSKDSLSGINASELKIFTTLMKQYFQNVKRPSFKTIK